MAQYKFQFKTFGHTFILRNNIQFGNILWGKSEINIVKSLQKIQLQVYKNRLSVFMLSVTLLNVMAPILE